MVLMMRILAVLCTACTCYPVGKQILESGYGMGTAGSRFYLALTMPLDHISKVEKLCAIINPSWMISLLYYYYPKHYYSTICEGN